MSDGKIVIEEGGERFDIFLMKIFPSFSRSHIKELITSGNITLDGKVVKAGIIVSQGQEIEYHFEQPQALEAEAEDIDFEIVYEDDDLLVINKPQGLVVHPCQTSRSGTLVNGLLARVKNLSGINGVLRPGIVHRLDKNTSGLMIVAKNDFAHNILAKQIAEKDNFKRCYLALCEGHFKNQEGRIESFITRDKKDRKKMAVGISGKFAVTNYRVVQSFEGADLVEFSLETGRTHQIRVHCKMLGHSVVGDDVYGHAQKGLKGQLLHSYKLSFIHPRLEKVLEFEIDLPTHFKEYMKKLKEY